MEWIVVHCSQVRWLKKRGGERRGEEGKGEVAVGREALGPPLCHAFKCPKALGHPAAVSPHGEKH